MTPVMTRGAESPRSRHGSDYVVANVDETTGHILKGDEASFPTADEVEVARVAATVGIFDTDWTASSQTQKDDLVLSME